MRDDILSPNSFSNLHGFRIESENTVVLYCKIDWLDQFLSKLSTLDGKFVVVSSNSDYCIGHSYHPVGKSLPNFVPSNVIKVYSQNCLVDESHPNYSKFDIIPIGIASYHDCVVPGNGGFYPEWRQRYDILRKMSPSEVKPNKFVYANFFVRSDDCQSTPHRKQVRSICQNASHIDWEDPTLTSKEYWERILSYDAVVCAQGNGPGDNHRLYEVLYLDRIPITFNPEMHRRLHRHFPVVCLESPEMLMDKNYIEDQVSMQKSRVWDRELLYCKRWFEMIVNRTSIKDIP